MGEKKNTGIYFCDPGGIPGGVDQAEVAAYAIENPEITIVWKYNEFPMGDATQAVEILKQKNIKRIMIAGDMPGTHKSFFAKVMVSAGLQASDIILAGFREHGAISKTDSERAKAVIAAAVQGISFDTAAYTEEISLNPDTLVIGGGIAGIQASLEIADAGQKVYLLEKSGTIGGHMAMFDKTFPTLDCAACILTPKMVEIGQHQHIKLMTYCEVKGVSGTAGNYKVHILKKARRVDLATCIGCGTCAEKCPGVAESEFDAATTTRKAIYIPFPQAVPNKYLIDAENCTYVKNGKCGTCVKVCPVPNCINLDEKDEEIDINVGNIIVATGFKVFDAAKAEKFGYGKYPNVLTSLEFERLVNAAGPTGGNIVFRGQDKKGRKIFNADADVPKSVAIIHCIGSRDENHNKYCSKVCCMYSLKLAHLVVEKLPDAKVYEYFIDMRAFGKGYEEFYERIKHEGVHMIRGKTAKIEQNGNQLMLRTEDILNGSLLEQKVDMVILAVGLEPREDAGELADMLGIRTTDDGWFMEANAVSNPVNTFTGGIAIAGVCQGPKDIPDTVAQASAAASRVLQSVVKGKINKSVKDLSLSQIESQVRKLISTEV